MDEGTDQKTVKSRPKHINKKDPFILSIFEYLFYSHTTIIVLFINYVILLIYENSGM